MSGDFYEPKSQKGVFGNIAVWVIALVVLGAVVGGGITIVKTVTASPSGKAGAYRLKESTANRVQKQEMFEQLNADIDGFIAKIGVAKAAYARDPSDINSTNLTGVTQICIDTVQQYNAESRKYTSRDFKSFDLPQTRDPADCR